MQTLKTCSLTDDYKHVCFKDLDCYVRKDDLLAGYSSLEQEKIRKNLGIINQDIQIDRELNIYSENPLQNKVVYNALNQKVNIDSLADVAITGEYRDIKHKPCELPNPEVLVVKSATKNYVYDGKDPVAIELPTSIKDFPDYVDYVIDWQRVEDMVPIKTISVNGKIISPDNCKNVDITVPTKVSELQNDSDFATNALVDSKIFKARTDVNSLIESTKQEVLTTVNEQKALIYSDLSELSKKVETYVNSVDNKYTELKDSITAVSGDLTKTTDTLNQSIHDLDLKLSTEIASSTLQLGETSTTAYAGDKGKILYDIYNLKKDDTYLYNIEKPDYRSEEVILSFGINYFGTNDQSSDGIILNSATTTTAGIMTAKDKELLLEIPSSIITATGNIVAKEDVNGLVIELSNKQQIVGDNDTTTDLTKIYINNATKTVSGLMSATDKTKLDSVVLPYDISWLFNTNGSVINTITSEQGTQIFDAVYANAILYTVYSSLENYKGEISYSLSNDTDENLYIKLTNVNKVITICITRSTIPGKGGVPARTTYSINTTEEELQIIKSGTTRPTTGLVAGYQFFDTTLNKPIWYTGSAWVGCTGETV